MSSSDFYDFVIQDLVCILLYNWIRFKLSYNIIN
jgi:hypothetical protein